MPPRIQIRPPRREAPINVNETWQTVLEPAIKQLYGSVSTTETPSPPKNLSFKVLYDSSYRLVTQGHGKTLYRKFTETTRQYLESLVDPDLKTSDQTVDSKSGDVLEPLSKEWLQFQRSLVLVRDVLLYLDRSYCDENGIPRTEQVGKQLFRDVVVSRKLDLVFDQVIAEISRDRNGQLVNLPMLKSIIELLGALTEEDSENSPTLYDTKFRPALIQATVEEYQQKVAQLIEISSSLEKLSRIEGWIENESHRGEFYLPPETTKELSDTVKKAVIEPVLPEIFSSHNGVSSWVGGNTTLDLNTTNFDALKLAATLEQQSGQSRLLAKQIAEILAQAQRQINETPDISETDWVNNTIELREKYVKIADTVGNEAWKLVLQPRFYAAIEEFAPGAEFLANYLNNYLRKSGTITVEEIEPALNRALLVYPALRERDTFGKIFQRLLARRLVNNSTRSKDLEISWLRKVREEEDASASTTTDSQQFEKMVKDYYDNEKRAAEMGLASSGTTASSAPFMNVNVLRTDLWPVSMRTKPTYNVKLPRKLAEAQEEFEHAYKRIKKDRQLTWNYNLGNVDVRVNVSGKSYMIGAPVYCMTVLALFESDEVYTTEEIAEKTQIPMGGELERFLKSLYLVPGANLLVKNSGERTKDVQPSDKFQFNQNFSSPKSRIKLRVIGAKSNSSGSNQNNGSARAGGAKGSSASELTPEEQDMLQKDRTDQAAAVVVRLMKGNKQMNHAHLIQLAIERLRPRFPAQPHLIKTAIQYLLNKDYIERSEKDSNVYLYKA